MHSWHYAGGYNQYHNFLKLKTVQLAIVAKRLQVNQRVGY